MTRTLCDIYRSRKKEGLYLYVSRKHGLECVPEHLLQLFGRPELATTLLLTAEKKLARVDVERVLQAMEEPGYFLQMPPQAEDYMQAVNQHNSKLGS